jgi:SNF2 family DNA or RNA helicase
MGLGKTVQALALIVSRPSLDHTRKTTLIVAPVALMQQWKREIERIIKPRHRLTVHVLHGEARNISWTNLREYDVVLTTYGLIASELKRKVKWDEKLQMYPDARPSGKEDYQPILGSTSKWYRVILDEAQAIKNKATKAAIGASFIKSEYRWCMTGTPMQNSVTELYSLIHFLRIKPYNEAERFSRDFTKPLKSTDNRAKEKAMRQLQALLKAILLRRTKTSKIDGRPILQLPPKRTQEQRSVFSEDERDFYKALETQTQLKFNRYLKANTVGRNYSNILVLLLRLRQACCHPHLIKDFAINTGGAPNVDLIANARELPGDVVERLKQVDAFECPICMDAVLNPAIFNPCGHSVCEDCLARWSDQALNNGDEGVANLTCPHCRSKVDTLKLTDLLSFKRVYCQGEEGVEPIDDDDNEEDEETGSDSDSNDSSDDDDDDDDGEDLKDFIVPDDIVEYDSGSEETGYRPGKSPFEKSKKDNLKTEECDWKVPRNDHKSKSKGKGMRKKGKEHKKDHKSLAQLRKEGLKNKAAKKKYLRRLAKDFQSSAKIDKTMDILDTIQARGEGEKTIIFSGFTSFLDLLEVPIARTRDYSSYTRYDGSMTAAERNDAVFKFTDRPECTIMLVSLKAGNSGLNLTAASQVIILDPHWNGYVEAQAVDRAYRIGQQRPVEVHRILIDHEGFTPDANGHTTVEDRILALQEKKRELVETALDETAGRSIARLGVRELGFLFVSHGHPILTFPTDSPTGSQSNGMSKRPAVTNIQNPTCHFPSCLMVWCGVLSTRPPSFDTKCRTFFFHYSDIDTRFEE